MNDSQLIEHLGGSTKLAELLKYEEPGGVQRVQNWKTRGIPAQVKVDHPELFMAGLFASKQAESQEINAPAATENVAIPNPVAASSAYETRADYVVDLKAGLISDDRVAKKDRREADLNRNRRATDAKA